MYRAREVFSHFITIFGVKDLSDRERKGREVNVKKVNVTENEGDIGIELGGSETKREPPTPTLSQRVQIKRTIASSLYIRQRGRKVLARKSPV